MQWLWRLAQVIACIHLAYVVFIFVGTGLTVAGTVLDWAWCRGRGFVGLHVGSIGFVAARAWTPIPCPLTLLEHTLRAHAGVEAGGSASVHFLHALVFAGARPMPFAVGTTAFFVLVAGVHAFNFHCHGRATFNKVLAAALRE